MPRAKSDLATTVRTNLEKVRLEHDLSMRELAQRAQVPQKTVAQLLSGESVPTLTTFEAITKGLLLEPAAVVTPGVPTSVLMSQRIKRLIKSYSDLSPEQRDQVEEFISGL